MASPSRSSHATAWTLTLVMLLPVLYILTLPPFVLLTMRIRGTDGPPRWMLHYGKPADWLYKNTPLHKPMDIYLEWWERMLAKP